MAYGGVCRSSLGMDMLREARVCCPSLRFAVGGVPCFPWLCSEYLRLGRRACVWSWSCSWAFTHGSGGDDGNEKERKGCGDGKWEWIRAYVYTLACD